MASVSLTPTVSGPFTPGDEVSFEFTTSSDIPSFFGFQASLTYDADELSFESVAFNDSFDVPGPQPDVPVDASGETVLGPITAGASSGTFDGEFTLATFTFEAQSAGESEVSVEGFAGTLLQGGDNEGVFDGGDASTITIAPAVTNAAPSASDDSASVDEDAAAVPIDVLANDSDPDDDPLSVTIASGPANGLAEVDGDRVDYTPDADFNGSDSFTYAIDDGNGGTDTATVAVTVAAVNDAPVANDDVATVDEDSAGNVIDVTGNDTDVENDALTVTAVSGGSNGTAELNGGSVSYTPNADYSGSDSFTYTVSDGNGGTDTGTVDVTVDAVADAPDGSVTLTPSAPGPVAQGETVSFDLATTDGFPSFIGFQAALSYDADELSFEGVDYNAALDVTPDDPVSEPAGASGETTLAPITAGISDPATTFSGAVELATLNFEALGSGEAEIRLEGLGDGFFLDDAGQAVFDSPVTAAIELDTPSVAVDDSATVAEDGAVEIDVLANDTDPDGDTPTITAFGQGSNGSVASTANGLTYTPNADFNGNDSFTYTISDGQGGSSQATVSVGVTAVNDAPVANDDSRTVEQDGSVTVDVLANDSDADGDELSVAVTGGPGDGSVQVAADGTVSYTPDPGFSGDDAFTYTVSDGNGGSAQATVALQVLEGNEAPVLGSADSFDFVEGDTGTVFTAAASDPDGDAVSFSISDGDAGAFDIDAASGAVTFASPPAFDEGGDNTLSFTLTASDGSASDTQTVSIEVLEDSDGDLVPDIADNAINVANADQRDTDNDNYGNVIDGDFDQSGVVGLSDLVTFRSYYAETGLVDGRDAAADADFNGDGDVLLEDLITFRDIYAQPLGESFIDGVA